MNDQQRFTFTKEERVTGNRRIEDLFTRGQAFMAYPFRVVFVENNRSGVSAISVLISVPKKRIRSAVKRNKIKRLTREAFRLNKHLFNPAWLRADKQVDVAFIYVKDEVADYAFLEKGIRKALQGLNLQQENGKDL